MTVIGSTIYWLEEVGGDEGPTGELETMSGVVVEITPTGYLVDQGFEILRSWLTVSPGVL